MALFFEPRQIPIQPFLVDPKTTRPPDLESGTGILILSKTSSSRFFAQSSPIGYAIIAVFPTEFSRGKILTPLQLFTHQIVGLSFIAMLDVGGGRSELWRGSEAVTFLVLGGSVFRQDFLLYCRKIRY